MKPGNRKTSKLSSAWGAISLAGAVLCTAYAGSAAENAPAAGTGGEVTVPLKFEEVSYAINSIGVTVEKRSSPFKAEPALGKTIRRGYVSSLRGGANRLPFIWDVSGKKLYLDLNRNEDFTDDRNAVRTATVSSDTTGSYLSAEFSGVPVWLKMDADGMVWPSELHLYEYGSRLDGNAYGQAWWSGKVVLAGREYQVGWLPEVLRHARSAQGQTPEERGSLVIRDWSLRDQPFKANSQDLSAFSCPEQVFLGNTLYALGKRQTWAEGALQCQLSFRQVPAELGELQVTGKFIKRILLHGPKLVAVLDAPQGSLKVPAARYSDYRVELGGTNGSAYPERGNSQSVLVSAEKPATLLTGGPLTNSVAIEPDGDCLRLNYRLIGAGGETYKVSAIDYSHPPQFAVYRGDKKIASGKFEYG